MGGGVSKVDPALALTPAEQEAAQQVLKAAAYAYAAALAKADGTVQSLIDKFGVTGRLTVAPPA